MTITIKIARAPLEASFEVGSIGEALGVLSDHKDKWIELCDLALEMGSASDPQGSTALASGTVDSAGGEVPTKRTRGPNKNKGADPASAVAPAPLPVPSAPAAPSSPPDLTPNANGVPAFLDRTSSAAVAVALPPAAAPPPPPLLPAAPPVVPAAAPPTGILAGKVVAELERRAKGSPDGGQALADWLAAYGLTVKGAPYSEAIAAVLFISDEKLQGVAGPQGLNVL